MEPKITDVFAVLEQRIEERQKALADHAQLQREIGVVQRRISLLRELVGLERPDGITTFEAGGGL